MIWSKKSEKEEEKLSGVKNIPGSVHNYLATEKKLDADLAKLLKAVMRKGAENEKGVRIRIFDESDALAKKVDVKDYTSLDARPDLILYEGWFDEGAKQVNLEEKSKVSLTTTIFTEAEIQQQIETLKEPGDSVFFYLDHGSAHGGPLGTGAAIIELNPGYPGKKQKKYNIYVADVVDLKPATRGDKLFDSDKPKQLAGWVKSNHHKRVY